MNKLSSSNQPKRFQILPLVLDDRGSEENEDVFLLHEGRVIIVSLPMNSLNVVGIYHRESTGMAIRSSHWKQSYFEANCRNHIHA